MIFSKTFSEEDFLFLEFECFITIKDGKTACGCVIPILVKIFNKTSKILSSFISNFDNS